MKEQERRKKISKTAKLFVADMNGKNIFNINDIKEITKEKNIKIGLITVQKESAQQVCDLLIECGIKAIWNFAPITLNVPEDVIIKNEDLSASLMILSKKLHERK